MKTNSIDFFEQEDIEKANELAKGMMIDQVPQLIVSAMLGNQNATHADSSSQGLVLSKEELVQVIKYVKFGLEQPQDEARIKKIIPYNDATNPYLNWGNYQKVFNGIYNHCALWSDLEEEIKKLGTRLSVYAINFENNGNGIIEVISEMPCQQVGSLTQVIPFKKEDEELNMVLLDILEDMKKDATTHHNHVSDLCRRLESFRNTLEHQLVPETAMLEKEMNKLDLAKQVKDLTDKKNLLQDDLDTYSSAYSKLVGYAFTGTSGLVFGPIGIISWAITGGVFGAKAEKMRKKINETKAEIKEVSDELTSKQEMIGKISSMRNTCSNTALVVSNAVLGVKHLDTIWNSVEIFIKNAQDELSGVKDSTYLAKFKIRMRSAIDSWKNVGNITDQLVALFTEALEEAKK